MTADRKQRRQRRRDLLDLGTASLKRGLPLQPSHDQLAGLALVLRDTLADTTARHRASRAAQDMQSVFEASIKAAPSRLDLACRRGCGYCCHNFVAATAPELFLLARTLTAAKTATDGVIARAAPLIGVDVAQRFGRKLPCPLLVDDACSAYAARPIVCRQTTATDLTSCLEEFNGQGLGGAIIVSGVYLSHARNCRIPLQAALLSCGFSQATYELAAGLTAALAPDAEHHWLSGVDPLARVATAPSEPEALRSQITAIAAEVGGL